MEKKDSDDKSVNKPKKSSGGVKKPKEKLDKSIEEVAERLTDAAKNSGASTSTQQQLPKHPQPKEQIQHSSAGARKVPPTESLGE